MQVGLAEELPLQQLCPDACVPLLDEESERALNVPMKKKHAVQFASIVGHLERAGTDTPSVVVPAMRRLQPCLYSATVDAVFGRSRELSGDGAWSPSRIRQSKFISLFLLCILQK